MNYTAVLDLARTPVSYDVAAFLIRARMAAGEDSLLVAIEPRHDGGFIDRSFGRAWGGYDEADTEWRFWNIVVPLCRMVGARIEMRQCRFQGPGCSMDHSLAPLIAAARKGVAIPKLRPSEAARRFVASSLKGRRPIITMTLRGVAAGDGAGETARNSNAAAWHRFYAELYRTRSSEFEIILLPDSGAALQTSIGGPFALVSPDLRLALYEAAVMNFIGQNGPAALCWYSKAPFIQFGCGGHFTDPPAANWTKHWADMGLKTGDQLPWSRPDQRLVYVPDTFENIVQAFADWRGVQHETAA